MSSIKECKFETSLFVQWLRLCASNARGAGLIPSQGTKIPHVAQTKQFFLIKIFKKKNANFIISQQREMEGGKCNKVREGKKGEL